MPALLRSPRRRVAIGAGTALVIAGLVAVPAPAGASTGISGVKVTGISSSGFSMQLNSVGSGWTYHLYASTNKTNVQYANLSKATYSSSSTRPRLALGKMRYTTAVYWWRVQATKGKGTKTSAIYSIGLRPSVPTNLVAAAGGGPAGTYLTWSSGSTTSYEMQQATDSAFSQSIVNYKVARGDQKQLTPFNLTKGTTYFWRIRAVNNGTRSGWSAPATATDGSSEQPVRVMTYNILTTGEDGTVPTQGADRVAAWSSDRRDAAASWILANHPDVIGIQEGADFVGATCSDPSADAAYNHLRTRMVDDLGSRLRAVEPADVDYQVAHTETPPCMHDATQPVEGEPSGTWFRTGVYVIFDNAKWQAVGAPGTFDVGQIPNSTAHRFAAFVMLRNRVSGAQFLFVSPHLYVNSGSQGDQTRQQETATMIAKARQLANGLPIVYAGDTNSQELHPLDGPVVAARSVHVADAIWTAQGYDNRTWNSANQYYRSLSKWQFGRSIDKVFAEPGVGVVRWGVYANVVSGQISGTIPSDHNPVYADLTLPY